MVVRIKRDNQCKALRIASGTLENVSFYRYGLGVCVCVCAPAAQSCLTLFNPWTVAHQAPLSIGFSRQEHWSGLPFPSPGDLPDPGIEPTSPALAGGFFNTEPQGKSLCTGVYKVAQSCTNLCDTMHHSLPGSSVHRILQARTLEWVAFPFSRGSSQPRDQTQVSCIVGRFFTI